MLNRLLAIEMLFVIVRVSTASVAPFLYRIDLRHIGFDFFPPFHRFDKD